MTDSIALFGAPGSPYTRKMLAVLRYRRIPYRLLPRTGRALEGLPKPKVGLLPTFFLPSDQGELEAVTDSTPIIRRLERDHAGRGVRPTDPALAFLDALIEDYADEWLTKAMFHYRWAYADDIRKGAAVLPGWSDYSVADEVLAERGKMISERQISRLYVVGSNPTTGPVIEASYKRFLALLEDHLRTHHFLMGDRPGTSDFGVFGQLTQLAHFDPTPMAVTLDIAPRVLAWSGNMEDLSGMEPDEADWIATNPLPQTLTALLAEIGRTYVPVMLANAQALADGATEVRTQVDGQAWTQSPFPYQAKCLQWLRADHGALPATSRAQVDAWLAGSGCDALFR